MAIKIGNSGDNILTGTNGGDLLLGAGVSGRALAHDDVWSTHCWERATPRSR